MKTKHKYLSQKFAILASGTLLAAFAIPAAHAGTVVGGAAPVQESAAGTIDYANAIPMPMPQSPVAPIQDSSALASDSLGVPGHVPGAVGNGKTNPVQTPVSKWMEDDLGIESQEFGTSNHPFTTSRVDLTGAGTGNTLANGVSLRYPYRVTGKLFFNIGASTYVCSASLIKRGIIVTAAHCVANYGKKQFYTNWKFHPARYNGTSPYGVWSVNGRWVMSAYYNGTDTCASGATGVVCKNDIAVLRVTPSTTSPTYPGTATGWYGYGYNGYGFTANNIALFNQLGYPQALDSGEKMQRTDSQAFVSSAMAGNSVWGSLQTGGSSGGPELVNLGVSPLLSTGYSHGSEAQYNTVVGVTSWGYIDQAIKQQGASPFLSTNIVTLVNSACTATPAACN